MKKFIFHYILLIATIAVTTISAIEPSQAQSLPDVDVPSWLEPFKKQLWTPQGLLTLAALGVGGYWIMSGGDTSKKGKGRMASAHWAGNREKKQPEK